MYIKRYYDEEKWKEIELKAPFCERFRLYVSNYGQIKKYSKISDTETILSQAKTEGYPSFNITYLPRLQEKDIEYFAKIRESIEALKKDIKTLALELIKYSSEDESYHEISKKIEENQSLHDAIRTNYNVTYRKHEIKRKLTFGGLTHRFVAQYFLDKPLTEAHKFVAHLDYDKENNHYSNLKWMTQKESTEHQKKSPYVIKAKESAIREPRITRQKLTVSEVMIIKKRINEDVPLRKLAKRYKVSETQLLRIKRGINWGKIPAAL